MGSRRKDILKRFGVEPKYTSTDWQDEWVGMPEYDNDKPQPPEITATFKFRNSEDFDRFVEVVKSELYNDVRVFDGNQIKNQYSAWFPLDHRPSEFIYVVDGDE
jgi:hypothetical protein